MFFKKRRSEPVKTSRVEETVRLFDDGLNCAQALLISYGREFGIDREHAVKLGAAFGSGMGLGETCGAVTGAIMVIGLLYGKSSGLDYFAKEETYDFAADFITRFRERNRTIVCRELLGCDVTTTDGLRIARQERKFKKDCPRFVRDAAELLEEMMKE